MSPPTLTLVAGPNGAGKSTFTRALLAGTGGTILDPDAIATRLDPTRPERAAIRAGRELIRRRDRLLVERASCIVETTHAGLTTLRHIDAARAAGFQVHLIYICAEPVETCIRRVAERVAAGGHPVSEGDIRRRYQRSLANLPLVLARCDAARLFDNSGAGSGTLVLAVSGQRVTYRAAALPAWVRRSVGALLR